MGCGIVDIKREPAPKTGGTIVRKCGAGDLSPRRFEFNLDSSSVRPTPRPGDVTIPGDTAALIALRQAHPVFRRRRFFIGRSGQSEDSPGPSTLPDIDWLSESGAVVTKQDWQTSLNDFVGIFLNGEAIPDKEPDGERTWDNSFLIYFNRRHVAVAATIPTSNYGEQWTLVLDTASGNVLGPSGTDRLGAAMRSYRQSPVGFQNSANAAASGDRDLRRSGMIALCRCGCCLGSSSSARPDPGDGP
jgi:hypothetical protein